MKQLELRIGNYVEYAGVICEVEEIHKKTITTNGVNAPISSFLSIPLTEEWLLKLGFYKSIENSGNLICYKKGGITIGWWLGEKWQLWIGTKDIRKSPQYVHQLQNLYFALTGEELTIKQT